MKKLATILAAIALIGTPVLAADLNKPVYKSPPPPPPAPVYSWTGWYVGGNVGYGWGDANTDLAGNGSGTGTTFLPSPPVTTPFSFAFADSKTSQLNGVIGGGQVGYNYQFSPNAVLGFEADFQGSGERGSGQFADPFTTQICLNTLTPCTPTFPLNGAALTSYQAKIDWFGTVRGRLGFLVGDQLLIYGTGGLAYGRVAVSGSSNVSATILSRGIPSVTFTPTTAAFSASGTNIGWTAGAGIEGRFSYWLPANWTWKLEYLYLDLGSLDNATPFTLQPVICPACSAITGNISTHTHFTDNIVRVGLNYQFH